MTKHDGDFSWIGSEETFIDISNFIQFQHILVGRYGGNSNKGQTKNEDGCLVWYNEQEDWEFAIVLDAHHTSESAQLILKQFYKNKTQLKKILSKPMNTGFKKAEEKILQMFQSKDFLTSCRHVTGETSCLIVLRKGKYVWWFSVGDCVLYLFHEELASLGQFAVNERQFYEWVGQVNTFDQDVPCYTVGTRELRKGENRLFLTTDGLLECPNEPYSDPIHIYNSFQNTNSDEMNLVSMFEVIKKNGVKDNTTIITWKLTIETEAAKPSI